MPSDDGLDELIEQITLDAYGDEGHWCFLQAFEDAIQFPIPATLAGIPVMVTGLDFDSNEQRAMVATLDRDRHTASSRDLSLEDSREGSSGCSRDCSPVHLARAALRLRSFTWP